MSVDEVLQLVATAFHSLADGTDFHVSGHVGGLVLPLTMILMAVMLHNRRVV